MKLNIKRSDLLEAVSIVEKAVNIKSTTPILECIYIKAENNEVTFIGNNLELCIICKKSAEINSDGVLVVRANLFSVAVKKLPDTEEYAVIELDENKNIILSCGNAKFNFSTASADEFPNPTIVDNTKELILKENILKNMLRQTVYAIAQTEIKPFLSGVYFELTNGALDVVGCDSYRLAIRREKIESDEDIKFIMPGKTVREIISILGESEDTINIKLSDKHALLELKNCIVITRLIDGNYINYKTVASSEKILTVVADTKNILNSVDRAALITSDAIKAHVILTIKEESIFINCETVLGKVNDKINVGMSGEPIEIAFNPRYLLEAFKNIESSEIKIQFAGDTSPITIEPIEGDSFTSIVLPVRLH